MKFILFLGVMFFFPLPSLELKEVRELFYSATENSSSAELFHKKLKSAGEDDPVLLGYKGMSEMVQAKYSYNPVSKLAFFKKGKTLLERAIEVAPDKVELRYLRFSIQTNAPSFLNYKSNLEEDKLVILNYMKRSFSSDPDLEKRMKAFILDSRYFSEKEKNMVRK